MRAVIFDLDGTLADSLGDIGGAMNEALAARGLPVHPLPAYHHFIGEGVEVLARKAAPMLAEPEVQKLVEEYRVRYAARIDSETKPYDGIPAMLDALVAQGTPIAVLSNKRDDFTKHLVAHQFGRWPFVEGRGERDGVPRKPNPTAALELALALNVLPERIGLVGDTPIDVHTARNAGMS